MKVLIVKMSSMGDVVHTLPAVTDAAANCSDLEMDWVVEEAFAAIPAMHPAIKRVIPVAIRRWRRRVYAAGPEFLRFLRDLRQDSYDVIIDAQGLLKSAIVGLVAKGGRVGYDWAAAREPLASITYTGKLAMPPRLHAVEKVRRLFAGALHYEMPLVPADFGLCLSTQPSPDERVMFLHGTTWDSKHWPEACWISLARIIRSAGMGVVVPHGNARERARAGRIAAAVAGVRVMDPCSIGELAQEMSQCVGIVSVDSGPGHLAAAVGVPLVGLYGPTDPALTGPQGRQTTLLASRHLPCIPCLERKCRFAGTLPAGSIDPPCFSEATPARVWDALRKLTGIPEQARP